jgi:DNA-binding CsgD family transcriptional regulator
MEGLIKFVAVMVLLYMLGWLGTRNQRRVEKWFSRLSRLFGGSEGPSGDSVPEGDDFSRWTGLGRRFGDRESFQQFLAETGITPREWEVIDMVCDGCSNREIEEKLFISVATVKDHLYRIYRKTGVKNRVQLANFIRNRIDYLNREAK